ncbi:hypothetical protein [Azotobacter chroococcum]|uniref:hypothetical protein n=1 Tax=Azotobacter chroococcum TaxID=353 RepID=UPI0010AE2FB1|nr:hypothetical protein [Azotobacter chroococcum]TKD45133.1 hypothetical protein FCG41_04820 [Azotobacter chroococcum]
MQIDFRADLLSFVIHKLGAFGIKPPSADLTECTLLLFKLQRRCPEAKPRQTRFSASFEVPRELQKGLQLLCDAIHRGDDLAPYLSRQTFNPNASDRLLDDWEILHLHMGMEFQKNGLIEGTKIVSFVLVRDDFVYFIDALPHGNGHATVWVQENLIHIIEKNWPELLPSNHSLMTPDSLSSQERLNLRKKCVNVSVSKQSGEVIMAPGGGMMVNGTAVTDFMALQKIYAQLDYLE